MRDGNPEILGTSPIPDPDAVLSLIDDSIIVDSSVVCGRAHALISYARSLRNIERGTSVGSSQATEFFRQVTGERQVSRAIKKARIKAGQGAVLITYGNPDEILLSLGLERDDGVLECEGKNCEEECLERSALVEIL